MYILSPNSLGVRKMALIFRRFQNVHTFTELTRCQTDGINLQEASACTYFHQTQLTWQVALIKMGRQVVPKRRYGTTVGRCVKSDKGAQSSLTERRKPDITSRFITIITIQQRTFQDVFLCLFVVNFMTLSETQIMLRLMTWRSVNYELGEDCEGSGNDISEVAQDIRLNELRTTGEN